MKAVLARIGLILFGLSLGLALLVVALEFFLAAPKGTEFASLDEMRRAMLAGGDTKSGEITGNLRGIINAHPDDKIIFDLRPALDTRFQQVPLRTNACGMRGPEREIVKAPNVFRIALLGDSFAFGWGVEEDEAFAARLERNLNRLAQGKLRFEVLNFAVPGYSTFQEVAHFKEMGLDFDPDAVIVFFVNNDFGLPFYVRDVYRPGAMLPATTFARLSWKMIDPKIEEQRLELLGFDPNSALRDLAETCRQRGIRLYVTFNPKKDSQRDLRRLWILRKRQDIRTIVFRTEFLEAVERRGIREKDLSLPTDPHPSAVRHALYGDMLTPYFLEFIP